MKFCIIFYILALKFVVSSSPSDLFNDLIVLYHDLQVHLPDYFTYPHLRNQFADKFCIASDKILSKTFPPKLITQVSKLCDDNLPFVLFFWANNLTISFEGEISFKDCILKDPKIFRDAIIALYSYVRENLLVFRESDQKRFIKLVLKFYHTKLRSKFKESQGNREEFDRIDLRFHRIAINLASGMYEYKPPEDIHLAIRREYQNILIQPDNSKIKEKFFYLLRYLRIVTSEYDLLTWLIDQPLEFIKIFLAFNTFHAINTDVKITIPVSDPPLKIFHISLTRIVPIFKLDLQTKRVTITHNTEEISSLIPCLKNVDNLDLTRLLNRFFQKLSN
jgi:hypothetical protein